MRFGIDLLLMMAPRYRGQRLALVTNDAALTSTGEKTRAALLREGFPVVKIFSPEHGINAAGEDGAWQSSGTDPLTGLPLISLYGDQLAPSEEDLKNIDCVIFDIPDIGCRFYTYLWTMTYVMESCARDGKQLIILDRPNPIGADLSKAEGPMLDEAHCSSFIGRWNIPLKHACTLGELAQYFRATRMPQLNLHVIQVADYTRNMMAGTDFPFTPTSPAIQNINSALLYPGLGLLEGVNVNENRDNSLAFQSCGAPWIRSNELAAGLSKHKLPGLDIRPMTYTPQSGLYAYETCHGVKFNITDSSALMAVDTGIKLLQTLAALYPEHLTERLYKTLANPGGKGHLERLVGVRGVWERIMESSAPPINFEREFLNNIQPYILYQAK